MRFDANVRISLALGKSWLYNVFTYIYNSSDGAIGNCNGKLVHYD